MNGEAQEAAALLADRLAALIASGLPPHAAWNELDVDGSPLAAGILPVFTVAVRSGSPLAPALRSYAAGLRGAAAAARQLEVAVAGPRATARLVTVLPALGPAMAFLLGFDVVAVAVASSPLGAACLAVGGALGVAGSRWSRKIVAAAEPRGELPGALLDLVAVALRGGLPADRALQLGRSALGGAGDVEAAESVFALARRTGVPVAALLEAEAESLRRRRRADVLIEVEKAGSRLILPLGVCVLPSFLLLGVAPALLAIVSSTVSTG